MEISTTRFGTISVPDENIITMKTGLIGFPDKRRFVIIRPRSQSALYWFQSADDPALAFVITSPYLFFNDYRIDFGAGVLEELEVKDPSDLEVYVLVTIPAGKPQEMTANLIGPLVVNHRARRAEQLVLEESSYSHKEPLLGSKKK